VAFSAIESPFHFFVGASSKRPPIGGKRNPSSARRALIHLYFTTELELELIQTPLTQQPLLWVEVGAHAVVKKSEHSGVVWAGAGFVSARAWLIKLLETRP
jgi:hypothetical protein